jgi:hypothetical protein
MVPFGIGSEGRGAHIAGITTLSGSVLRIKTCGADEQRDQLGQVKGLANMVIHASLNAGCAVRGHGIGSESDDGQLQQS